MKKDLPTGAVIAIIAVVVVVAIGLGLYMVNGGLPGQVPKTEQLKPEEASARYEQMFKGGGSGPQPNDPR